jgi:hypothetical protein
MLRQGRGGDAGTLASHRLDRLAFLRQPPPSLAPPDVSLSGIFGFLRHELVLLRDELEGQAAAVKDRAAPYGTVLKTFEHQNRLALAKTDVHFDTPWARAEAPGFEQQKSRG